MDEPKPEWLLVIYVTIAMTCFTLVGYSVGDTIRGVTVGIVISLATSVAMGVKMALDYNASLSWSKQER